MFKRGVDGNSHQFINKPALKWWDPSKDKHESALFACECNITQIPSGSESPGTCWRCKCLYTQRCSKCSKHRIIAGSTFCKYCIDIPDANKDITVDECIWRYKGVPFYAKGKTRHDENDDFVMVGYVNVRIGELEAEVKELRGIVDDLLQCIRLGKE